MVTRDMRIIPPVFNDPDYYVNFRVQIGANSHYVFFRSLGNTKLQGNLEAYLSCAVLPCMKAGGGMLAADGEASKKFLFGLEKIQDIYRAWDKHFKHITITGEHREPEKLSGKRVGVFFSGGINSFYTLIKNQDSITDLIFVHGLDIELPNIKLREIVAAKIHEIASHFGKNVIEIETNVREDLNVFAKWEGKSQGAALASTGHFLSSEFSKIYIPAALTHANMVPWGCHPLVDPHWSSSSLEFASDGVEATRMEKIAFVSKNDKALQYIRVCCSNVDSQYNCCRCEKCVLTMVGMTIHNKLERCASFEKGICLKDIYRINTMVGLSRVRARINLDELEKTSGNKELKRALEKVLKRPKLVNKTKLLRGEIKDGLLRVRKLGLLGPLKFTLKVILPAPWVSFLRRVYLFVFKT